MSSILPFDSFGFSAGSAGSAGSGSSGGTFKSSASSIGAIGGDIGGAVTDLFSAFGAKQAAGTTAAGDIEAAQTAQADAGLAEQNLGYSEMSTGIKQVQADRNIYQTISGEQATIAGNGLESDTGSAADILADSARQGSLTKSIIGIQGEMDANAIQEQINGFNQQASSYTNAASAAESAGNNGLMGGVAGAAIKGVTAAAQVAMMFA